MARPRPPRQTTSLGPGDHPRCRAGIGARQQQLAPLERPPGATALVPRPPFQPVPRLHPTPQNMLLGMWSRGGCKGTTGWEISPTPGYQTSRLAFRLGKAQHGPCLVPLPNGLNLPAGIHTPDNGRPQGDPASQRGLHGARQDLQQLWDSCTQICVGAEIIPV